MMNRGVMDRQMFANGGQVRRMQAGGDPMMAPPAQPPMGDQMGMPPAPSMAGMPVPPEASMDQAAAGAMQQGIDPAILESMLQQAAGDMGNLDAAAETEDYEQVINTIRGDQAPLQERRQELAGVVGDADAAQTPDSVLTLVQPIMQIAAVDQGIGSVAPEAMNSPIEGDMAGGIMSTVNMAEEQPMPMPGPGGTAPVNFNLGGAVQYFDAGGVAMPDARQQELFEQQRALYGQLIDPEQQASDLAAQRNMTQAQMLFDIAQGGLALATPGDRNVSPISRFAEAFTPVLGNIGARAGELGKFEQAQKAEKRQLDMAALQGSQSLYSAERAAQLSAQDKDIGDVYAVAVTETDENGQPVTRNLGERPLTRGQLEGLYEQYGMENVTVRALPKTSGTPQSAENFMMKDGSQLAAIPGTPLYSSLVNTGAVRMGTYSPESLLSRAQDRTQVTLNMDVTLGNRTYPAGSSPNLSSNELNGIASQYGADAYKAYTAPVSERDYFNRFGMTQEQFADLDQTQRQYLQGLPVLTDRDYFGKFGMDRNAFEGLQLEDRQVLLGIDPDYSFETLQGEDGSVTIVRINERTGESMDILDRDVTVAPSYFRVTMPGADGQPQQRVVDIKTPEGQAVVSEVNSLNASQPGSATLFRLGTEDISPRGFYVPGTDEFEGGVYTSYDGGRTFTDTNGVQHVVPSNGFEVSNTIAYDVNRNARITAGAQAQLDQMDSELVNGMTDAEGNALSGEQKNNVRDALRQARLGTGFWSKVASGIDGILGGTIGPEYFGEMFRDRQDARQYIEMVRVFGRSALAASPRYAVADLETTARLFPDERAFFRNPVSEARKLTRLAEELQEVKREILDLRTSGVPIDSAMASMHSQKLFEIERLQNLLGPILTLSATANAADLERAQSIMNQATGQGNP